MKGGSAMECNLCNSQESIFIKTFENYPLTNIYLDSYVESEKCLFDIEVRQCLCGHVFSESKYSSFYTDSYSYNGSAPGVKARRGIGLAMLKKNLSTRNLNAIVDIGGGQLEMLRELEGHFQAIRRIAIDPVQLRDASDNTSNIEFYNEYFNGENFKIKKSNSPSLFILDNVLEHIKNLDDFLYGVTKSTSKGDFIYVCVPSRDVITQKLQFQEIIHEHINYFSLESVVQIFGKFGFNQIAYLSDSTGHRGYNYHLFLKDNSAIKKIKAPYLEFGPAFERYKLLLDTMLAQMNSISSDIFGVCASELTSTLAYHMDSDFSFCKAIYDTSPHKLKKYMPGVNSKIESMNDISNSLSDSYYFITAPTIAKYVIPNLNKYGVTNIILPIGIF
jgi:hypothetical protein